MKVNTLKIFVLFIVLLFAFAKHRNQGGNHKKSHKYVTGKNHLEESQKSPRFIIPKPLEDAAVIGAKPEAKPETISIVKKSGAIKDSELPGAFGEDYSIAEDQTDGAEVDSGSSSGSGDHDDMYKTAEKQFTYVTHDRKAENAANFGNNVVPKPGINPMSAFLSEEQNHAGIKGDDKKVGMKHKKQEQKRRKAKNSKKETLLKAKPANARSLSHKKESKSNHVKDLDIVAQIKNIEKKINEVEKKNGKKHKTGKGKNLKEKVSSYIKQLEHDITNEINKDDDHVKRIHSNNSKQTTVKDTSVRNFAVEEQTKLKKKVETKDELPKINPKAEVAQAGSPEGFECPWICFWTCHSYCPKECCNNPFQCPHQCKEFCTPYCSDKCCAPGSRRMPKLQINFHSDAETGKKDLTSLMALKKKTYEMEKAKNETNQIAKQLEALKQASFYAAQAIGLPDSCPLFCPQICTPGLCKPECCSRSDTYKLPRVVPSQMSPKPPAALPAAIKPQPQVEKPALPPAPVSASASAPAPASARPAPVQSASLTSVPPAALPASSQLSNAVQALTQGMTTTASQGTGKLPLEVVSSYTPASPSEIAVAANVKGEKIGEFSISQPNGQVQTFNVESGPISVVPNGPGPATNEQIKTEQTAYIGPEGPPSFPSLLPQAPPAQKATQRVFCPTPIGCPEGGIVDPDYCPPICRTACIEQCPNECCPNYGHSSVAS